MKLSLFNFSVGIPTRWALLVFLSLAWLPARAASLLNNPGFEYDGPGGTTNLPGWLAFGPNNYTETKAGFAHGGTNYYKLYQAFNGQVNYSGIYQDYISGPGAVYSADGWAYTTNGDTLAGQNLAWVEVTFRDAAANTLALYRSAPISTNTIGTAAFPVKTWVHLFITNQFDPGNYALTNQTTRLVAPPGTYFVRYQITLMGDPNYANGSVYFDDLNLASAGGAPYGNYNLVWSDEFNSNTINPKIWGYDTGTGTSGWGNHELEYYTSRPNNVYESGGYLHILAQKESYGGSSYTSARVKSQGLFSFLYGRLEWRAQLPAGSGFWPALWALGNNISSIGWPGCGEIDLMENNGSKLGLVQGSLHSGSDETGYYNLMPGDAVTTFHTYTLDWTTNALLFYVDGHLYERQTGWSSSAGSYPFPFNQPFFLIMNVAVGGDYLGDPSSSTINATTAFPGAMLVDYVRIYTPTAPLALSLSRTNSALVLSWPSNILCHVQGQVNPAKSSLDTNWVDLLQYTNNSRLSPTGGAAYFRLASP